MHVADLGDASALARVVAEIVPDWVVHLAGIAFVGDLNVDAIYRVNLVGTRNLLEALVSSRAGPPGAVLLASSANVYGNAHEGRLSESTLPDPANDYAVSKLAMEYVARLYSSRLPLICTRPFNYTGVGQSESFLVPKIVAHMQRRASHIELGNVDVARDFSDVRDVAAAYVRLLEASHAIGCTVNVCSGKAYTLRELIAIVERLANHRLPIVVNPAFVRANEVRILLGDRTLLDALTSGSTSKIPFADTLKWMLDHPQSQE